MYNYNYNYNYTYNFELNVNSLFKKKYKKTWEKIKSKKYEDLLRIVEKCPEDLKIFVIKDSKGYIKFWIHQ